MTGTSGAERTIPSAARPLTKSQKARPVAVPTVVQLDGERYAVASTSAPGSWQYVLRLDARLLCACLGFEHTGHCRHCTAVRAVLDEAQPCHPLPRWPGVFR